MPASLINETDYLPIFAGIQPTEFRRQRATLSRAYRSFMDPKRLLHQLMVGPITAHEERLRFPHPFVPAEHKRLNELSKLSIRAERWTINGTRSILKVNHSFASLFQSPVLGHLAWVCPYLLGYDSNAFALVLKDFSHPCTKLACFSINIWV